MFGVTGLMKKAPPKRVIEQPPAPQAALAPPPKLTVNTAVDGIKSIRSGRKKVDPFADGIKSLCGVIVSDNLKPAELRDVFRKMAE